MILKSNTASYNDGSGLYDTAGILKSAIEDINALVIQGVANWTRAANAVGKIQSAIRAVEARDREDEAREKTEGGEEADGGV